MLQSHPYQFQWERSITGSDSDWSHIQQHRRRPFKVRWEVEKMGKRTHLFQSKSRRIVSEAFPSIYIFLVNAKLKETFWQWTQQPSLESFQPWQCPRSDEVLKSSLTLTSTRRCLRECDFTPVLILRLLNIEFLCLRDGSFPTVFKAFGHGLNQSVESVWKICRPWLNWWYGYTNLWVHLSQRHLQLLRYCVNLPKPPQTSKLCGFYPLLREESFQEKHPIKRCLSKKQ